MIINRDFKQPYQRVLTLVLLVVATLLIQCHCGLGDGKDNKGNPLNNTGKGNTGKGNTGKGNTGKGNTGNNPITDELIDKGGGPLQYQFSDLLQKLLKLRDQVPGEDINEAINSQGETALGMAVDLGNKDIIKALLDIGADVNKINTEGRTPLHQAVMNGSLEAMQALLDSDKIDLNAKDNYQKTALHYTIVHGDDQAAELIESLLKKGADVNTTDRDGETILYKACTKNGLQTVIALLNNKDINVNLSDKTGKTPLKVLNSRKSNYLQIKQLLESKGAN